MGVMTLTSLARDRLGPDLKLKVSRHVVCAWSWSLVSTLPTDDDPTEYSVVLRKSHPWWEMACHYLSHLPDPLDEWVAGTAWFRRLEERYSVDIVEIDVPDELAQLLYLPLWEATHFGGYE